MREEAVAVIITVSLFITVIGIFYIRSRENMALIERGLNPRGISQPRTFTALKIGLVAIGMGLGALLAMFIMMALPPQVEVLSDGSRYTKTPDEIHPALMAIFGGLGLLAAYRIERREREKDRIESPKSVIHSEVELVD
jgi:hypothetical protein